MDAPRMTTTGCRKVVIGHLWICLFVFLGVWVDRKGKGLGKFWGWRLRLMIDELLAENRSEKEYIEGEGMDGRVKMDWDKSIS